MEVMYAYMYKIVYMSCPGVGARPNVLAMLYAIMYKKAYS